MTDKPAHWFGIQERLETTALQRRLEQLGFENLARWSKKLPPDEIAPAVAAHLGKLLAQLTLSLRDKDRATWIAAFEQLAEALEASGHPLAGLARDIPVPPFRQLLEVVTRDAQLVGTPDSVRPDAPLGVSALLTGSSRSPSLITQIRKELLSADRADWLVSFIKWSGIRPLRETLQRFTETPGVDGTPRLRIATTSYLGATDLKAVEFLDGLPNTQVRVSYDTHRTRLHAKAYVFHRDTEFGSAYVGSANVSRVALDEGLEWTAKISQHELPYLWRQIVAAFESHWEDPAEFEPLATGGIARLKEALLAERQGSSGQTPEPHYRFFDLKPYGFQQEILEGIDAERRAGIFRHLVIAATGTGKTMVAAFDYRRSCDDQGGESRPSLLFVAHREEILRQSLETFRHVLRDSGFGDLLLAGSTPTQTRHLFCSVQSWHSRGLSGLDPAHFEYVVLDEAHHAAASSYQALLRHLQPRVLLGLTATPERSDGRDIRDDFGGRFTHEMRLPDAIDRRLLAPFQYFGIADHASVDLTGLEWKRGGYLKADLDKVFGANEVRAKWVLEQVRDYVADLSMVRGLGFCVSQEHARFMARTFNAWGLPSAALTAGTSKGERGKVQQDLVQHRIRFIFTVDLYNEGVDIPEVDTILMLRPTESLVVYLQQLGRGLRLHAEKPHLTVLDFIAPQHRQFRYASRFRALTSNPTARIDEQLSGGFPWLPSGCLINLDRIAAERVLENIRNSLGMRRPKIIQQLALCRQHYRTHPSLKDILDWFHFDDADDLLRHGLPCRLLEAAGGQKVRDIEPYEKGLTQGLRRLASVTDTSFLDSLGQRLDPKEVSGPGTSNGTDRTHLQLVHSLLWGNARPGDGSLEAVDGFTQNHQALRQDLLDVVAYQRERIVPASGRYFLEQTGVLELHARYTREQILLALGKGTLEAPFSHREGVLHLPERRVDALFVTISKSASEFSPTTMYEDYAVTDSLFHWQSQSGVGPDSSTGMRYRRHQEMGYVPMLFVRPGKRLENGLTTPFYFCGPLRYLRHEGSHPMSIVWRLEHPMPARIFRLSQRAAA